jgi:proprotein convertase subtilisin/kexin type 5
VDNAATNCYNCKKGDGLSAVPGTCAGCHVTCKTCFGGTGNDKCTSCHSEEEKLATGVCTCPAGYTRDGAACKEDQMLRDGCKPGWSKYGGCDDCQECFGICNSCIAEKEDKCTSCKFGLHRELKIIITGTNYGKCVCKPGFYEDRYTKECMPCHKRCLTCDGPEEDQCLTCGANATATNS